MRPIALRPVFRSAQPVPFVLLALLSGLTFSPPAVQAGEAFPYTFERVINFDPSTLRVSSDPDYQAVTMDGTDSDCMMEHVGQPRLPVAVEFVLLPPDRAVDDVDVMPIDRVTIPGTYRPVPIQGPSDTTGAVPDSPPWLPQVYPTKPGFLIQAGPMRRYWLAKIAVWPVEFDGATGELRVVTSVRLRVRTRDLTADERANIRTMRRPELVDGLFGETRAWVRRRALNGDQLDRLYPRYVAGEDSTGPIHDRKAAHRSPYGNYVSAWPSLEGIAPALVIVTGNYDVNGNWLGATAADSMTHAFREYATMLSNVGIRSVIKTVDEIDAQYATAAGTVPGRIHAFLDDAVSDWGTPYVLLI